MQTLSRKDIRNSILTGLYTGAIFWRVFLFLGVTLPLGVDPVLLVPGVPVLWLLGVQLGYYLAQWLEFFRRFGRFSAIGFSNAGVDFGILYLLIALTGHAAGVYYSSFKSLSFMIATAHSYFWNKNWAFDAGASSGGTGELAKFFGVSVTSLIINVGVASAVVAVGPWGGIGVNAWAGIGAVAGSAVSLFFSFVGFKLFVFHK